MTSLLTRRAPQSANTLQRRSLRVRSASIADVSSSTSKTTMFINVTKCHRCHMCHQLRATQKVQLLSRLAINSSPMCPTDNCQHPNNADPAGRTNYQPITKWPHQSGAPMGAAPPTRSQLRLQRHTQVPVQNSHNGCHQPTLDPSLANVCQASPFRPAMRLTS